MNPTHDFWQSGPLPVHKRWRSIRKNSHADDGLSCEEAEALALRMLRQAGRKGRGPLGYDVDGHAVFITDAELGEIYDHLGREEEAT